MTVDRRTPVARRPKLLSRCGRPEAEPEREATVDSNELDAQRGAYREGFPFYRENELMLNWYAGRIVRALAARGARSVVSLGIGQQIVGPRILRDALPLLDAYYVVEGSGEAIEEFRRGI